MNKFLLLLPIIILLIFSFEVNSKEEAQKINFTNLAPTATPTPADENNTDKLILDKEIVCHPCPPGFRPREGIKCDYDLTIAISAGESANYLKYEYTVSGGQIIGKGAEVKWDLTGAQPGNYQIRADIEDSLKNQKRTETKIIEVRDGGCFGDCECPTLSVSALPSSVRAGETITFTANVSGGSQSDVTYNWTISDGEITQGQGTPIITVATNSKIAGKTMKATVEISGVCDECPKTASAVASIAKTTRRKN